MWQTIGHEKALNILRRGLQGRQLSHGYLLVGPPQVGKMTLALDLARALNCEADGGEAVEPCGDCGQCRRLSDALHADLHVVGVGSEASQDRSARVTIGIDQVREIQRMVGLKPYEGRYRVFIFDGAEHLSDEAANSLLKTLEEPPQQVVLLLLTADWGALLPTIVSRCHQLELRPLPVARVAHELERRFQIDAARADEIGRLSGGRIGWAFNAATDPEILERRSERLAAFESAVQGGLEARFSYAAELAPGFAVNREAARRELALWLEWWRDVMVLKESGRELVTNLSRIETLETVARSLSSAVVAGTMQAIQRAADHLERNVNTRLALEELMLALPRL